MSLFNDSKNAGLALVVCAILLLLSAIVSIVDQFVGEDTDYSVVVAAVGCIIGAFLYFGFGRSVMSGELSDKFDIVCRFVQVFGFVYIVEGIFYLWNNVGEGIVSIVIGLIALLIFKKITDGKATTFDKLVWIILLILFILTIIAGIALICKLDVVDVVLGISYIFIGVFMTMSVLDNDVKAKFGM